MDVQEFVTYVPKLSDLELAVLLSLIARQHCLVYTQDDLVDNLASELALIVSGVFRLTYTIVNSEDLQSPARFGDVILGDQDSFADASELENDGDAIAALHSHIENVSFASGTRGPAEHKLDSRLVVNVVIAKDFNMACDEQDDGPSDPEDFFVPPSSLFSDKACSTQSPPRTNDRIFMSHYHSPQHGFPLLEEMTDVYHDGITQIKTVEDHLVVPKEMIEHLHQLGQAAAMTPEIRRYLQDVVVFLRVERDVDGGVTPHAGVNLLDLAKYLAPLHGIDFVTPALIGLAAKKVYMHRLVISSPGRDLGRQHDHNIAGKQQLVGREPEEVIESVLEKNLEANASQYYQQVVHYHFVSSTDAKANKGDKKRGDYEAENLDRVAKSAGLVLKNTVCRWGTFGDLAPNAKTEMATIAIDRIKRSGRLDHILIN
ncbi:hypothetical protein DV736_g2419, partial [Chaetothyriales sp. CBS 134916]